LAEQAALELAASNISVTVLCPALVRTAMSDQGDDPLHVAAQALEAVDEGRFAVIPEDWSAAVRHRSATLVNGVQPAIPIPARP
jgi:short-subunit dehydrogenase